MPSGGSPLDDQQLSRDAAELLADTMFALSTPSRLQILASLQAGPMTVSEIIAAVGMEQSAVSHQLRVLRDHAVVSVERRGRERLYGLRDSHVGALLEHDEVALAVLLELDRGAQAGEARADDDVVDMMLGPTHAATLLALLNICQ